MKRFFFLLIAAAICVIASAHDIIVTHEAERIDAIIEEVSETQVKYKKADNPNGPTFVLSTNKISSIVYQNGTVQTFAQQPAQSTTPTLRDISRMQEQQYISQKHVPTPAEGPWLVWGVQVKEGYNMYFASSTVDYDTNTKYRSVFGMRFLPSVEGYVEFAPKQEDMGYKRHAVYMGLQYTFRGGQISDGIQKNPMLDLQYLCFRPAYSVEHKVFYSRTGIELGVLTVSRTKNNDETQFSNVRESCAKATFGIWEEFGWVIKDHFNIGLSFTYVMSNATTDLWGHEDYYGNWVSPKRYSPQLQIQLVLGWRFNPYKFDKKKVEPIEVLVEPN